MRSVTGVAQLGYEAGKPPSVERILGTVAVTSGFKPYTVPVPPDLAALAAANGEPIRLKLTTSVWIPQQTLGTQDDRDLGVMVDRVAVR